MLEFIYKNVVIETDFDDATVKGIVDELIKRRFFIKPVENKHRFDIHTPSFFHIGYKGHKVSILIKRDIEKRWCCWIFSIQSFSEKQPPIFIVD